MVEFDPVSLLRTLDRHDVRFVVIGGLAAVIHGAPTVTTDLDVVPATGSENLEALTAALTELGARLRTVEDPDGIAFPIEPELLAAGQSWTLVTAFGDLDLMFQPEGTEGYPDLVRGATTEMIADDPPLAVVVATLPDVIRSKEAAGRDKDRAMLPLLRRTLEEATRRRR